jgi:hypothetical protein
VCRRPSSSPLRVPTVGFARARSTPRCKSRAFWGTLAPAPQRAAARRRVSLRRRQHPAAPARAQHRGRQISIRRPRSPLAASQPGGVPVNPNLAPALDLRRPIAIQRIRSVPQPWPRVFANKTLSFPGFATRSSHLIKPLRISPVFFCFSPRT